MDKNNQATVYGLRFEMVCPEDQKIEIEVNYSPNLDTQVNEIQEELEKQKPKFTIESLSFVGELVIKFDQKIEIPLNITEIDTGVLRLELILDESNFI